MTALEQLDREKNPVTRIALEMEQTKTAMGKQTKNAKQKEKQTETLHNPAVETLTAMTETLARSTGASTANAVTFQKKTERAAGLEKNAKQEDAFLSKTM